MDINTPNRDDTDAMPGAEDQAEGRFKQFTGKAEETYGDLSDDWSEQFKGNVHQAMGWLQEQYGDAKERLSEFWDDAEQSAEARRAA